MTNDQLQRGCDIAKEKKTLESNLAYWKNAESFGEQITLRTPKGGYEWIENSFIDFDVVKFTTIGFIEKRLRELKEEFDSL
jgi:hypothetical protein